jgi:OHCU decarboxylase
MLGKERVDITDLNQADDAAATAMITPFIERGPDLASRIARYRPFSGPDALAEAIRLEILELGSDELIALFRRHPELAPAAPEAMTVESQQEQHRLGLALPEAGLRHRLAELNARYAGKFGFPFIIALHRHKEISSVVEDFERRLDATIESEIATATEEVASVSRMRVLAAFATPEVAPA